MARNSSSILRIQTSWGTVVVTAENGRITGFDLPRADATKKPFTILTTDIAAASSRDRGVLRTALLYFRTHTIGGKGGVRRPPFAFPEGTVLQQKVWKALASMKSGEYTTYGGMAATVGRPRAARAIGQACGANPLPILIPCHRVLGVGPGMGGFSSGLAWKRLLIERDCNASADDVKRRVVAAMRYSGRST